MAYKLWILLCLNGNIKICFTSIYKQSWIYVSFIDIMLYKSKGEIVISDQQRVKIFIVACLVVYFILHNHQIQLFILKKFHILWNNIYTQT